MGPRRSGNKSCEGAAVKLPGSVVFLALAACASPRPPVAPPPPAPAAVSEAKPAIAEEEYRARAAEAALARTKAAQESQATENRQLAEEVRRLQAQVSELEARQTQRGWVITVGGDLLFDVGRSTLKPGGRHAIDNLARIMRQEPERKIVIEGFTDSSGGEAANRRLSERRAQAVRDALVQRRVASGRIVARGLGEAYPVASNESPAGRQLNRRVEILIGEHAGRAATGSTAPPSR